ncbi:hypothetical protein WJX82_006072 [Trebouxia sp. C0006]
MAAHTADQNPDADLEDVEMEEVEANKLVEDDSASRPGVGIGAGVGAAASVVGPSRLPEVLAAKWQAADTQGFTFSKPSAAWQTETLGCGELQAQTSASIFAYRGDSDNRQAAMSQAEARAESWKQGLDEALQRGTATLKSLRVHMQQQEADLKACKQQREAEFKALEKPGPLQHGHFRSEKVQVNADGLAAELKVQQGQQGTSTGLPGSTVGTGSTSRSRLSKTRAVQHDRTIKGC